MSSSPETAVVIASLQVQSSFQSVPLGAACVVSALRADSELSQRAVVALGDWSLEDEGLSSLDASGKDADAAGEIIGKNVAASLARIAPGAKSQIVGFSTYVWNRPAFEAAAARLEPTLRLVKVDTEEAHGLAGRLGIRSIPTLALFRGGREIARQAGAMDVNGIVGWARQNL